MSALMTDVIEGSVTPVVANAAVNAGGKLLKAAELELKYGRPGDRGVKTILLCGADDRPEELAASTERGKRRAELLAELAALEAQGD